MTNFGKTVSVMIVIIIAVVAIWLMSRKPAVAPVEQNSVPEQQMDTVPSSDVSKTDDVTLEVDLNAIDASLGEVSADAAASAATQ